MRQTLRFLPLGLFLLPLFLLLPEARGAFISWLRPTPIDTGYRMVDTRPSMASVNGRPAMAYIGQSTDESLLFYQSAQDGDGAAWNPARPQALVFRSYRPIEGVSLAEVDGRPAILFIVASDLLYTRATDDDGLSWETPRRVTPRQALRLSQPQLFVIDGAPVALYETRVRDSQTGRLGYRLWHVRAQDATGAGWKAPVMAYLDEPATSHYAAAIVDGLIAATYAYDSKGEVRYLRAANRDGTAWAAPSVVVTNIWPESLDLTSLAYSSDGRPAIAFFVATGYQFSYSELYYIEAEDPGGSVWGLPQFIAGQNDDLLLYDALITDGDESPALCYHGYIGNDPNQVYCRAVGDDAEPVFVDTAELALFGLIRIDGRPAIGTLSNDGIRYSRAADPQGAAWPAPVAAAYNHSVAYPSALSEVQGLPAVGYYHQQSGDLLYAQGRDAQGVAWATPVVVDSAADMRYAPSLAVVGGVPAVSYFDDAGGAVKFARALDPAGAAWGDSVVVGKEGEKARRSFLFDSAVGPAIGYYANGPHALMLARATSPDGAAWAAPLVVHDLAENRIRDDVFAFAPVLGRPAAAYRAGSEDVLLYSRALDAEARSWSAPVAIDTGVGSDVSLRQINGRPAVAYLKTGKIWFALAADGDGRRWNKPVLAADEWATQVYLLAGRYAPLIVFNSDSYHSPYVIVEANDVAGASWGEPIASTGETDAPGFAALIGDCPSVSFYRESSLGFMRLDCSALPVLTEAAYAPVISR